MKFRGYSGFCKRTTVLAAFGCLILLSNAHGFDGQRKGLVVGFGAGYATRNHISYYGITKSGYALDFIMGYSPNNRDMFLWSGKGVATPDNELGYMGHEIDGFAWYHYFHDKSPSLYTIVGAGISRFYDDCYDSDYGPGLVVGTGYELIRHMGINVFYLKGWPEYGDEHFESISIALGIMIY